VAVTSHDYPKFNENAFRKVVNVASDTLKVMALTAYTYSDSHATIADVLAAGTEVANGNGYTTGGITVAGVSIATVAKVTTLTATSPALTVPQAGSLAFAFLVWFFDVGGTNSTRYPVAYDDMGGTLTYNDTVAGTEVVTLAIAAGGLKTLTAS
jgi:hypothetical protein